MARLQCFLLLPCTILLLGHGVFTFQVNKLTNSSVNNNTDNYIPRGVGSLNITDREFTEKIKNIFQNLTTELLCPVRDLVEGPLGEIPNITCSETLTSEIITNMTQLVSDYNDTAAQNNILEIFWSSKVGSRMLTFLEKVFESDVRARVKELWFEENDAFEGVLFSRVFLGYEYLGEEETESNTTSDATDQKSELNINGSGNDTDESSHSEYDYEDYYYYHTAPVSWTGQYFRNIRKELILNHGKISTLVNNSMYLADLNVTLEDYDQNITFIIGTTFIFDFASFTMCWAAGAKLEKCVVPLPGNDTAMVEIHAIKNKLVTRDIKTNKTDTEIACERFTVTKHV